jgi:hypothetical protein
MIALFEVLEECGYITREGWKVKRHHLLPHGARKVMRMVR